MIVANALNQQSQIEVNAPIGNAYLREQSFMPILFVAGGTGIAPLKSIIEHLVRKNSKREMFLYWGARQPEFLYLHELFSNLSKILKNFHYVPIISGANDAWHGKKGLVHQAVLDDFKDLSRFAAYICGPFDMCFIAREDFAKQGLNRDNMYSDAFSFG
ncbi:MAG: NAD(P)H-flavin reductase [Gammaproteobacteria bacterium]|nr:NAD(P)H-flavin reductase [Gammaproteobacteria bacterium]